MRGCGPGTTKGNHATCKRRRGHPCGFRQLLGGNPCAASKDCESIGVADAACVAYGNGGIFCGVACSDDSACPTGYECKAAKTVEGAATKQCLRKPDDASGKPGTCTCGELATAKQLSTSCFVENKSEKGELIGLCPGTRACSEAGLAACTGPPPAAEACDGLDNDCDGKTDEATCDDNNGCTVDACDPTKAGAGKDGCVHSKLDGECDADGSVCTEKDTCKDGICVPGKAKNCNDGNPCTLDACDAAAGCTATEDNGKACDDDNACTAGDTCKGGACAAGKLKECATSDACVAGKCDLGTGKCDYKKLTAACDDNNPCTDSDTCSGGFCTGAPVKCNDNNPCTADVCKANVGCTSAPNTAPCDDGNACTDNDGCLGGKCAGLPKGVTSCDDGNPCTTDSCAPKSGCLHAANAASCNDGNPCTVGDTCKDKACTAGTNTCDCNADKDCAAQDDSNLCNGSLYCDKAKAPYKCVVNPKTVVTCPDPADKQCSSASCVAATGKCEVTAAANGKPCDADGSVCTQKDACAAGKCTAGAPAKCDDGNPCTTDSCNPQKGCEHADNTSGCNADDNACTVSDGCKSGVCLAGPKKSCDDGNDCTVDLCQPVSGACNYNGEAANGIKCDVDGSACTPGDSCKGGVCANGAPLACDDGNPCTKDACDAKSGCTFTPQTGPCDDGNACTTGDVCDASSGKASCKPGKPTVCDDKNDCTVDSCEPAKGGVTKADTSKTFDCYGGEAKTKGVGECTGGKQTCKADGTLSPCFGEVVPAKDELCDGKDNTCDGKTDTGCAAIGFSAAYPGVLWQSQDSKVQVTVRGGPGVSGQSTASAKHEVRFGLWAWLAAAWGE